MIHVWNNILPIFLIIVVGKLMNAKWITADEFWRGLEKFAYFVLFPCALFNYISVADFGTGQFVRVVFGLLIAVSTVGIAIIINRKRFNCTIEQFTSIFQGGIRYNNYIFFALAASLYGKEGLTIVAVISAYMIIFVNFASIFVLTVSHKQPKDGFSFTSLIVAIFGKVFSNPIIIASVVGMIAASTKIVLPFGIRKFIQNLSDCALTVGVLSVGAMLQLKMKHEQVRYVAIACVIKLICLPTVAFVVLTMFQVEPMAKGICLLFSGLPTATGAYVLSRQFGGDSELMASIITATTMLSIFSLSFIMYICNL